MAREKLNLSMKKISLRVPEELYADYKAVLAKTGSIVTYDIRNYMKTVVDESKGKKQEGQK